MTAVLFNCDFYKSTYTITIHARFLWYNSTMKNPLVAVASERSSAYGRSFIEGIARYSEENADWNLVLVDADRLVYRQAGIYDGWICRTANDKAISTIKRCGRPTVDAFCTQNSTGFSQMRTDAEEI